MPKTGTFTIPSKIVKNEPEDNIAYVDVEWLDSEKERNTDFVCYDDRETVSDTFYGLYEKESNQITGKASFEKKEIEFELDFMNTHYPDSTYSIVTFTKS